MPDQGGFLHGQSDRPAAGRHRHGEAQQRRRVAAHPQMSDADIDRVVSVVRDVLADRNQHGSNAGPVDPTAAPSGDAAMDPSDKASTAS